jgi:putative membrane protein
LLVWLVLAVAIGLTAWLVPGMEVNGGFGSLVLIAAVFGLVNAIIGRIVKLLTLPLTVLTLGLFGFVITALMLWLTDWWVDRLDIDGIGPTLVAALLISVFSSILQYFVFRHEDKLRNR